MQFTGTYITKVGTIPRLRKPLLVTDFLDRARDYYGDKEAVVATTGERYTYDELGDRADRLSAVLEEIDGRVVLTPALLPVLR